MKTLKQFTESNGMTLEEDNGKYICHNPWGEACLELHFDRGCKFSLLKKIKLPRRLVALQHPSGYEFIFQPVHESQIKDVCSFDFVYANEKFHAEYRAASSAFEMIARAIRAVKYEDTDYSNVLMFGSFFRDVDQDESKGMEERITSHYRPINFFLEGDFAKLKESDHYLLFRHINFYMEYYIRQSPKIILRKDKAENESYVYRQNDFCRMPKTINANIIDDTILLLLESARETESIRLRYIYYYQVLEYCAYYYLDNTFKRKIHNMVESPRFFSDMDSSINSLIDVFQDNYNKNNTDSQRLEKVLCTYIDYNCIKSELEVNEDYFRKECVFDGGYVLPALLGKNEQISEGSPNLIKQIRTNIEKIRNVLVHVRESRESSSIAPTSKNSNLLKPYLYLICRIAEELASRHM